MEFAHIVYALIEGALLRNALKRYVHDFHRVVADEGGRIEGGNEGSSIETVAAVHYVSYLICNLKGLRHHARSHKPDKVSLNLEVQIVCVRVVEPMS